MVSLEEIRLSLTGNTNLTPEVRDRMFELTKNFNKKIQDINLSRLNDRLKTVKFGKISKFEKKGTYYYDVLKNEILFSNDLSGNYDIDHMITKAILEMSTSTNSFTGFNSDERLRALNLAYTEILANYIVRNEGDSDLEEEVLIANLLSFIVDKDTMYNSYFTNNGEPIIKSMQDTMAPIDTILDGLNYINSIKNTGEDNSDVFANIIVTIGDLISKKIESAKLTDEELSSVESFILNNPDDYFSHSHLGLKEAFITFKEAVEVAKDNAEKWNIPVPSVSGYEEGFKRL